MRQHKAFSYIDLMIAISCLSLLVAMAIPAWHTRQSAQRLFQATEILAQGLRNARSLSLLHNTPYFVHYESSTAPDNTDAAEAWCSQLDARANCHCLTASPACPVDSNNGAQRISARDFPGIHLTEARFGTQAYTRFEPVRGTARFGHLRLDDDFHHSLQINVSLLGRVRICRPEGTIITGPYPRC